MMTMKMLTLTPDRRLAFVLGESDDLVDVVVLETFEQESWHRTALRPLEVPVTAAEPLPQAA